MRDLAKWWNRRGVDPESGMNHLAHVATNTIFLLHFALNPKRYGDFDDRSKKAKGELRMRTCVLREAGKKVSNSSIAPSSLQARDFVLFHRVRRANLFS
jgi:hypothetical protein